MNIVILVAGIFSMVAFFAHAIIGDREYRSLQPADTSSDKIKETWIQARGGWHWVSVDLLGMGVLLIIISATDLIIAEYELLILLSIYYLLCGAVWLITVFVSRNSNKQILVLGQWIFCFVMSALVYFGATTNA